MSDDSEPDLDPGGGSAAEDAPEADAAAAAAAPIDPLEEARAENKRLRDQLLRTAADFDNFRKRSRREVVDADRRGREDLLKELLPVFDNLERAVAHTETASDVASLAEGIRMVMRQFGDTLGRVGVERLVSHGQPFDPSLHEAIQQIASSEHAPGTITAEVQAGYRMGERLIRPAMVVVAKAAEEASPEVTGDAGADSDAAPGVDPPDDVTPAGDA